MDKTIHTDGSLFLYNNKERPFINQLLLAMKLFLILLAISLQVSAAALSQEITLSVQKAPLREVMQSIRKQSGYQFIIESSYLDIAKPVSVDLRSVPIEEALEKVFAEQPFGYVVKNRTVVVSKKKGLSNDLLATVDTIQQIDLRGRVVDSVGNPLVSATVKLKEHRNKIAITDQSGEFILKGIPNSGTLGISIIGYETKEVFYSSNSPIKVFLKGSNSNLDEIRVIAYGTTTGRLTTSNISIVKTAEIEAQPVNNAILALQGRIPGVYIEAGTGNPGGSIKVRIQGTNSIRNGNTPFYVIDGVPFTSALLPALSTVLGQNGITDGPGNPLNFINPSEIESIEILKDADATAIYGSRAANGAVLITTKKGTIGKTKFNLNLQTGLGQVTRRLSLLNTSQYLALRNEAKKNDNAVIRATDYDINGTWDSTSNTDWQTELLGGTAAYHDLQTSLSGGNINTKFNIGLGYHKETTVYPGDFGDSKGSLNFNINHASANQKLNIQFHGSYMQDVNKLSNIDLTSYALKTPPNAPKMYNSDGTINWAPTTTGTSSFINNPARFIESPYQNKTNNLLSNLLISYSLLNNLTLKTNFGYNKIQSDELQTTPLSSIPTSFTQRIRSASYGNSSIENWVIEPQLNYQKRTNWGSIDLLLGGSFQNNKSDLVAYNGTGYNTDLELDNIRAASNITVTNSIISDYKYNAAFGRLNYNLYNKYILNISARRDGSSRFGSDNLFHNFYSLGGAWIFSEEKLQKKVFPFLYYGKLRFSYGVTGSDQIGDYQYLSLYSPYYTSQPYQGVTGSEPVGHTSPNIQWEETRKLNIGLDLGLINNRIQITSNYFQNRSSNQLLPYPLPLVTGFTSVLKNIPAKVQNSGLELALNAQITRTKAFNWETNFNLTIPHNKLLEFPGIESSTYANLLIIGQPITIIKLYQFAGVNTQTGIYEFKNHKGVNTSIPNPDLDKNYWIDNEPKLFGGWQNNFNYKNIYFQLLFQFVKQTGLNYNRGTLPGTANNQPDFILNHWRQLGDISLIQKANSNGSTNSQYSAYGSSNASYSDASFIRLKNISISYELPKPLLTKINVERVKIYIQAQNLLTITSYNGMDPENRNLAYLPPLRVITCGFQLTL